MATDSLIQSRTAETNSEAQTFPGPWMKSLCMKGGETSHTWAQSPFVAHGYVAATNGSSIIAVRDVGRHSYKPNPLAERAAGKFLLMPLGDGNFLLPDFQSWLAKINRECEVASCYAQHECIRVDTDPMEPCFVFGCFMDRQLLFRFLRNIQSATFNFRAEPTPDGRGHQLIFGGHDWRVIVMGLNDENSAKYENAARYPTAVRP